MSDQHPVSLNASGPPETVLPDEPAELLAALGAAGDLVGAERHDALAAAVAAHPRSPTAWAALAEVARDPLERYACYRVGYHRGLDALRGNGWRGSGHVRWQHPSNRGFLRSLEGLRASAGEIDEADEQERCALFLRQLDPTWPPDHLT